MLICKQLNAFKSTSICIKRVRRVTLRSMHLCYAISWRLWTHLAFAPAAPQHICLHLRQLLSCVCWTAPIRSDWWLNRFWFGMLLCKLPVWLTLGSGLASGPPKSPKRHCCYHPSKLPEFKNACLTPSFLGVPLGRSPVFRTSRIPETLWILNSTDCGNGSQMCSRCCLKARWDCFVSKWSLDIPNWQHFTASNH